MMYKEQADFASVKAANDILTQIPMDNMPFREAFSRIVAPENVRRKDDIALMKSLGRSADKANAYARIYREHGWGGNMDYKGRVAKSAALSKAYGAGPLDVGTNTNFAQVNGGQSLGFVSLDVQLARGTIRPDAFALYQSLNKSQAFQVVDFWPYIDDIGGNMPGTNFQGFGNVASGTLSTSAGDYTLQSITLKMAANGRALTTALAAQNSFVDIAAQENANAALSVLEDFDWTCFWGNPTLYPNQPAGLSQTIPASNQWNFFEVSTQPSFSGLSNDQILFNLIYDIAAQTTKWGKFGHITHAFMSQNVVASLQSLISALLNNIVNINSIPLRESGSRNIMGMTVNADLDGMHTRFGPIRFPVDILITARDTPAAAVSFDNNQSPATSTNPTPPASVTVAVSGGAYSGSQFTSAYTASSGTYVYAVASTNGAMVESTLTYSAVVTGVTTGGAMTVTIAPPAAGDATVFRVYRSGLGYNLTGTNNNPASFRYIGSVAASGSSNATYTDYNQRIPGGEHIFLLDLDENDNAVDFRYLLPLTKIELFAQNLYMPWAVAMIGALRVRIPKFNAIIYNYIPDNPAFSPLSANLDAQLV